MGQTTSESNHAVPYVMNITQKYTQTNDTTPNIDVDLMWKNKRKLVLKKFENALLSKNTQNIMGIIEKYGNDTNLFEYYMSNGDTCLQYAVRIHDIKLLYYLLQKNIDVRMCF